MEWCVTSYQLSPSSFEHSPISYEVPETQRSGISYQLSAATILGIINGCREQNPLQICSRGLMDKAAASGAVNVSSNLTGNILI
jgi:hypothetical protein